MTTIESITNEQIETLRREAASAGDEQQVRLCDLALDGDAHGLRMCVSAISETEAQG